jgi:transcriptional regulator with XRE-family HTH domain
MSNECRGGQSDQSPRSASGELRDARVAVGMTQAELGAALVVNHATVSRWESGRRRPPHDLLDPLAGVLDVPVDIVASWFAHVPLLKGDGIGPVPGLKHLLQDRGTGLEAAAEACGVSLDHLQGWVHGRRTLQRAAVSPLARLLGMDCEEFLREARRSANTRQIEGSPLRRARLARRLTQDELGRRVGVAGATVSHWERGTWIPPVHQVFRLARVLRYDAWQLGAGLGVRMPDAELPRLLADSGVGRRLQAARLRAGLTRVQLARCVGVRSSTVGRWESGQSRPRGVYEQRLLSVLGVDALTSQRRERAERAVGGGSSPDGLGEQAGGQRCA